MVEKEFLQNPTKGTMVYIFTWKHFLPRDTSKLGLSLAFARCQAHGEPSACSVAKREAWCYM